MDLLGPHTRWIPPMVTRVDVLLQMLLQTYPTPTVCQQRPLVGLHGLQRHPIPCDLLASMMCHNTTYANFSICTNQWATLLVGRALVIPSIENVAARRAR